jgi:hypothetical protein
MAMFKGQADYNELETMSQLSAISRGSKGGEITSPKKVHYDDLLDDLDPEMNERQEDE